MLHSRRTVSDQIRERLKEFAAAEERLPERVRVPWRLRTAIGSFRAGFRTNVRDLWPVLCPDLLAESDKVGELLRALQIEPRQRIRVRVSEDQWEII